MLLFKINDVLKTHASIASEVLLYWLICKSKMSRNKTSNRAPGFDWLIYLFEKSVLTLCFSLFYCLFSVSGRTHKHTAITVMVFASHFFACRLRSSLMSASENGCCSRPPLFFTSSFFCNYVNATRLRRPSTSLRGYRKCCFNASLLLTRGCGKNGFKLSVS